MKVGLEHLLRLRQGAAGEVKVVLVPVAGGERRRIDRGLQVALVDIRPAGVDRQPKHGEKDEYQKGDQDDRLAFLELPLPGFRASTQHDKPHKQ